MDSLDPSEELSTMIDAARGEPRALIDPKTLPVRFSRLKTFSLSAAHYFHACQDDRPDTLALRMGSGVHAGIFEDRAVVCYDGRRAGKAWDAFREKHEEAGAIILNVREHAIATGIATSLRKHDRAMQLLLDGTKVEETILWSIGDRACRSTPDAYAADRNTDLKSTRSAEPRAFARDALRMHYHAQMAFYDDAIEAHTGTRPGDNFLVAVENVAPYPVVVWRLPDATREVGAKLCRQWWEQLLAAEDSGYYGGYVESDLELELPDYGEHEPFTVEINGELVEVA